MSGTVLIWVVVALVVALAVGPIMTLLPSKRDKRLAELRAAARRAGLVVEMTAVPKLDAEAVERVSAGGTARAAKVDCASYRLPLPKGLPYAPCWQLLKSERENRYLPGWTALQPPTNLPVPAQDYWQRISAILDALPGDCIGVQADARMVAWLGRERTEGDPAHVVAENIRAGLEALGILHSELSAAAEDRDG